LPAGAHTAIEADGQIEPAELARVTDLVQLAAPKYFACCRATNRSTTAP